MNPSKPEPSAPEEIQIRLQPILGVDPKHYLAGIYGLILAALIFFVFFWPGISNPGTLVTVESSPAGASVTFNGKLYGHTPLKVFFPEGTGPLLATKPGFQDISQNFTSGNNVFFSLFVPRTETVTVKLTPESETSIAELTAREISRWSAAAPFTRIYQFPPLFTNFVEDAGAAGWSTDAIQAFLKNQRRFVVDPQMYADYQKACGLSDDTQPANLETQYGRWEKFLGTQEVGQGRLIFWLLANQPKVDRANLVSSPPVFLQTMQKNWQDATKPIPQPPSAKGSSFSAAGSLFLSVPGGAFRWGMAKANQPLPAEPPFTLPVSALVDSFWLADSETTQAQFADFVSANPSWSPAQKATLQKQGLVDENYLAAWKDNQPVQGNAPVTGVSWFAAQAYVDWLNSSGKISGNKKAVLPNEVQWEWAAREAKADALPPYQKGKPNALGLKAMQDGVWEWTASSWAPGDQLVQIQAPHPEPQYPTLFRSVRGGSAEAEGKVGVWERAGVDAGTSNPYLGFRVAVVNAP